MAAGANRRADLQFTASTSRLPALKKAKVGSLYNVISVPSCTTTSAAGCRNPQASQARWTMYDTAVTHTRGTWNAECTNEVACRRCALSKVFLPHIRHRVGFCVSGCARDIICSTFHLLGTFRSFYCKSVQSVLIKARLFDSLVRARWPVGIHIDCLDAPADSRPLACCQCDLQQ